MSKKSESVLVIGDDTRIVLSVIRSLGRSGKSVSILPLSNTSPTVLSRYVEHVVEAPEYSVDPEGWRLALEGAVRTGGYSLVVPCAEAGILAIDAQRDSFNCERIAIPPADTIRILFDKEQTHIMCDELGVSHVDWKRLEASDDAKDLISRFELPLVLKPRRSFRSETGRAHEKVEIVASEEQLSGLLRNIDDHECFLVEGYFEGVGTGVSVLASSGRILQAFQHRRLREGHGGCSSYRESEPVHPELRAAAERICARTRYTGVCMFEFRFNEHTGEWILIEVNARFWGSLPLPMALGLDFPTDLYNLLVHGQAAEERSYRTGVRSRNIILDTHNLIQQIRRDERPARGGWLGALSDYLTQPVRWLTGREKVDCFALDDMKPALREVRLALGALFRRRVRPSESNRAEIDALPRSATADR